MRRLGSAASGRLLYVAVTWAGVLFVLFNITVAVPLMTHSYVDFPIWYGAGLITRSQGTAHIYDFDLMARVAGGLAGHAYPNPYISPPPLAWLAVPFTFLPYPLAFGLWVAALISAFVAAWQLAGPGAGWERWAALAVPAGLFPVAFGVTIGAVPAFGVLVVVLAWRALVVDRQVVAGLILSLLAIKPQLGILVAPALLLAGYRRVFTAWAAASAVIAALSLLALGGGGVSAYIHALQVASGWELSRRFTLAAIFGVGGARPAELAAGLLALAAAWRTRKLGAELPIGAGILGSLLVSPYISLQDFTMLVPAAWLIWRAGAPAWLKGAVLASAIPLEAALAWGPVPVLLIELVWLAGLLVVPSGAPGRASVANEPGPAPVGST